MAFTPSGKFSVLVAGVRVNDPLAGETYVIQQTARVEFDAGSVDFKLYPFSPAMALSATRHAYKYQARAVAAFSARKVSDDSLVTVPALTELEMPQNWTQLLAQAFGYADPASIGE